MSKKVKQFVKQTKRASRSSRSALSYYLVETGESRTPRPEKAAQDILQA